MNNSLLITFWGCLVSAQVWMAAGKFDGAGPWLGFAGLALAAHTYLAWKGRP